MTGKMLNKDFIALVFISTLTVLALVYGFSKIPSPARQRELKLDHKRVTDLGELQYSIDDYYRTQSTLPINLNQLTTNTYSYSSTLSKVDPETNAAYDYHVITPVSYELCATFKTDSLKEDQYVYDEQNYSYSSFSSKFKHPIGNKCFNFTVTPRYDYYQPTPTPGVQIYKYQMNSSGSAQ